MKIEQIKKPPLLNIKDFYKGEKPIGTVVIKAVEAEDILGVEKKGTYSDAQLVIKFAKKSQTTSHPANLNPKWNEMFYFEINYADRSEFPYL